MSDTKLSAGDAAPDFTIADVRGETFRLSDFRGKRSVALVFLRYAGCPICQLSLQDLKNIYRDFTAREAEVAVFVQSPRESIEKSGDVSVFPFRLIPDPEGTIYELYGVGSTNLLGLVSPNVLVRGVKAMLRGHRQGKMEGNSWQLPGDFVVDRDGALKLARIGKDVGDNLSAAGLLAQL